jgi:hypothetical protein
MLNKFPLAGAAGTAGAPGICGCAFDMAVTTTTPKQPIIAAKRILR